MPGGPFFSVLVSNLKTALHIRDMLMLNILMKKALAVTAGMLGTLSLLNGALVQVQQVSSPAGHLDNTQVVETGTSFKTVQPNLTSNGYFFGYWSNGNNRLADTGGRSVTLATVLISEATTLTAHYFLSTQDSDSDGIMDWYEYRNFGDLNSSSSDDNDGDGFSNGQENELGQESTIWDQVEDGGISSRVSSGFVYADTSMVHYTIKSNPIGFVSGVDAYVELNASVNTSNLHGQNNGYHFAYWSVNGVRQAGSTGVALSQVSHLLNTETAIVAHYIPSTEDTDGDGVMDWFEYNQFGNLSDGPNSDNDGDGFTNKQESELGQEATIPDQVDDGGISSRVSSGFVYADTSMVKYVIKSDPIGFINTVEGFVEINASVSTGNLHGSSNGYHFGYWTVNGQREFGPTGVALSQVTANPAVETTIVAHYFPSTQDNDGDGVADWYEFNQFGNLGYGPSNDNDGDGFTNDQENALGQEATIFDLVQDGGISSRISGDVLFFLQVNNPPSDLQLSKSTVHSEKPSGELVGTLIPTDPNHDTGDTYQISILDGNGSTDRDKFSLSGLNLFTTAPLSAGSYFINLRVSDDENEYLDKNFTISAIPDPNKDDDNDGLTYAEEQALGTDDNNPDSDGDGFPDALEIANGTNPRDPKSIINQSPTSIGLKGSSIAENAPSGSYVGQFHVVDPDANASINYQLIPIQFTAQTLSFPFTLEQNGTLRTTRPIDFENEPTEFKVKLIASDEWNATIEKEFSIQILDLDENTPTVSLQGEPVITLLTSDKWIDPGATWTDPEDGSGTVFAQNDFNQTHPTFEEWIQNGKQLPEDMMFIGGTPWFDESTGKNREDKEVYDMIFGILPGEYKLTYFYRDKAGNLSNLATRRVLVVSPIKAFVQTLDAKIDKNGIVQFGAEVPSGNNHNISEVGIHFGSDRSLSEFSTLPLTLSTDSSNYFSNPESLPGGKEFFYRAYAQNKAGISYGSVKSISIPIDSNSTFWWSGSIEEPGGWETSPWFGSFRRYPTGWIFHADLNWLYAYAGKSGDVWLWSQAHGWLWTGPDVYPHLFNHNTSNWFYFIRKQDGNPKFYDYTTESVK